MPIYEYMLQCDCKKTIDTVMSVEKRNEPIKHNCRECELEVKATRVFSKPLIISDDIGRGTHRMTDRKLYKELDIDS